MRNTRWFVILACGGSLFLVGCALVIGGIFFSLRDSPTAAMFGAPAPPPALLSQPTSPGAPAKGSLAPDFTLVSLDQQTMHLADLRGKAVVVNFWATWCAPCSAEMPNFQSVYEKLNHDGVAIFALNQGEYAEQVSGYADLYRLHFPILLDDKSDVSRLYHIQALPTTVFIDRAGLIRDIHIGGPMSVDFIQNEIDRLLAPTK